MLREIHTLYGNTALGYVWVLVQDSFGIMVFWGLRLVVHAKAPHGMSTLTYLVIGFGIWGIVTKTLSKCMTAVDGNRALLTFPQVSPLDIMIARAMVVFATEVVCACILLGIGAAFGFSIMLQDLGLLLFCLFFASLLGLGLGMTLAALGSYWAALHHIVPMILRVLFFASGIFFSVTSFSTKIGEFLLWNPILQLIEMARSSMSSGYMATYTDPLYILYLTMALLSIGLLLERYVRRRLQE